MEKEQLIADTRLVIRDILEQSGLKKGQIFVLGLSSSEVVGGVIGQESSKEVGQWLVATILEEVTKIGAHLAVQGCEHLNRALVVERDLVHTYGLEEVNVIPQLHAGGSGMLAAYELMKDPVVVEEIVTHAGLDIGDTSIGMHVRRVQVPLRPCLRELGQAHITALTSRPKLIGGERAVYHPNQIKK
ncbi:TIGR01440 family protein [Streptococcus sp. sy004]|uniref:TIGR01440 family protein n=1 Tax=Streptococcus sp. sy004 TaxID=2600149 RepID=UPI0011B3C2AA|nr:TIGR01440 family protein [Streptococcus sp. sy004]TWT10975.1 TIGR01440 family protein [Streptococcus sp. sy004]